MVIGFTGHRPERIISNAELLNTTKKVLHGLVYSTSGEIDSSVRFVLGGSPGFDTIVAETLWSWGINPENISILVPFRGFERYATKDDRALKRALSINNSLLLDRVVDLQTEYPETFNASFGVKCNLRNARIIDRSDLLVSYWDGIKKGGTYNTIQMAIRKNIRVLNVYNGVEVSENTGKVVLSDKE